MARVVLDTGQVVQVAHRWFVEIDNALREPPSQSSTKLAPMKPAPPVTRIMGYTESAPTGKAPDYPTAACHWQ